MFPQNNLPEPNNVIIKPKIDIDKLVETTLPPSPDNVMRLSSLLRDYNTPARKITEVIIYEPMLVAKILRLANSPIYGLERTITSIQSAIATVGNKDLLEIVMMEMASSTFSREIRKSVIARKIWEHSLTVALFSRTLAEFLRLQATDEAFTCGLLHDIGKMILLSHDFTGYSMIIGEADENQMLITERQQFGYSHAEVGSLVARRWKLQEEVCYTILYHHNSSQSDYPMLVAHIVEVADILANVKGYGLRCEDKSKIEQSESLIKLKLKPEDLEILWDGVRRRIDEVIKTFA